MPSAISHRTGSGLAAAVHFVDDFFFIISNRAKQISLPNEVHRLDMRAFMDILVRTGQLQSYLAVKKLKIICSEIVK